MVNWQQTKNTRRWTVKLNQHSSILQQCLQVVLPLECLGALVAGVLALVTVRQLVLGQCTGVVEQLVADWTPNHWPYSMMTLTSAWSSASQTSISHPRVMCSGQSTCVVPATTRRPWAPRRLEHLRLMDHVPGINDQLAWTAQHSINYYKLHTGPFSRSASFYQPWKQDHKNEDQRQDQKQRPILS